MDRLQDQFVPVPASSPLGFVLYALYYHFVAKNPVEDFGWRNIAWLLAWFGGMWLLVGA